MNALRHSFLASLALALCACAPLYSPPVDWTYDDPKTDADFRPDLTACVAEFDPSHIQDMQGDDEYQVTGTFIDTQRTAPVVHCMEAKGWNAEGPDYDPYAIR